MRKLKIGSYALLFSPIYWQQNTNNSINKTCVFIVLRQDLLADCEIRNDALNIRELTHTRINLCIALQI